MSNIQGKNGNYYLDLLRNKRNLDTLYQQFENDDKNGIKFKRWNVIPSEQYKNLLGRYTLGNEISKDVIMEWFKAIIFPNIRDIEIFTEAYNRKEFEYTPFIRWSRFPDKTMAWTDSLHSLIKLSYKYNDDMSAEEMLALLNMIINVGHFNGDLASAFIEGGCEMCKKISESVRLFE